MARSVAALPIAVALVVASALALPWVPEARAVDRLSQAEKGLRKTRIVFTGTPDQAAACEALAKRCKAAKTDLLGLYKTRTQLKRGVDVHAFNWRVCAIAAKLFAIGSEATRKNMSAQKPIMPLLTGLKAVLQGLHWPAEMMKSPVQIETAHMTLRVIDGMWRSFDFLFQRPRPTRLPSKTGVPPEIVKRIKAANLAFDRLTVAHDELGVAAFVGTTDVQGQIKHYKAVKKLAAQLTELSTQPDLGEMKNALSQLSEALFQLWRGSWRPLMHDYGAAEAEHWGSYRVAHEAVDELRASLGFKREFL